MAANTETEGKRISRKQRAFIERYLTHFNVSKAAREVGYNDHSGYRLMRMPQVIEAIDERFREMSMRAEEVIARLTLHARGSMADFLTFDSHGRPSIDLTKGNCALLRRVKQGLHGQITDIELYDAQSALVQLGKHYELFSERLNVRATLTGQVTVYIPDNGRNSTTEGAARAVPGDAG